jgi:DNA-binding NtrC family response regulator
VPPRELTPAALRALRVRRWPGNVRELRNVIERAVLLATGPALDAEDVAELPTAEPPSSGGLPFPATLADLNRAAVARMLALCDGNKTEAARRLGISRPRLHRLLSASLVDAEDEAEDESDV